MPHLHRTKHKRLAVALHTHFPGAMAAQLPAARPYVQSYSARPSWRTTSHRVSSIHTRNGARRWYPGPSNARVSASRGCRPSSCSATWARHARKRKIGIALQQNILPHLLLVSSPWWSSHRPQRTKLSSVAGPPVRIHPSLAHAREVARLTFRWRPSSWEVFVRVAGREGQRVRAVLMLWARCQ